MYRIYIQEYIYTKVYIHIYIHTNISTCICRERGIERGDYEILSASFLWRTLIVQNTWMYPPSLCHNDPFPPFSCFLFPTSFPFLFPKTFQGLQEEGLSDDSVFSIPALCTAFLATRGNSESYDPEWWGIFVVVIFFHLRLCHTESMQQGDQEPEQLSGDEREGLALRGRRRRQWR